MTLQKPISLGLCLLLAAAAWAPLAAARTVRRSGIAKSSRAAVSAHRRSVTVQRGGAVVGTRRVAGVSRASRAAVSRSTVVYSRSHVYRGVVVYRPHGHYYHGYGGYYQGSRSPPSPSRS